jgi:hypothetical protein
VPEALRNFLKEVSAILAALRRSPRNSQISRAVILRIQELAATWAGNVRPGLAAIGVPPEVLARTDRLTYDVARLITSSSDRNKLHSAVGTLWKALHEQILLEVARIPLGRQAAAAAPAPAALFPEISDLPNQLVPRPLQGWSEPIKKFLRANPFGKNVFVMVSYRAALQSLIEDVEKKLTALNLNPIVARDHALTNDLYNPIACLLCCSYGVAIFDRAETSQMHNPNVVYELGMMQLLKRPCVILKHTKLKKMPTDLLSMLYEDYSSRKEAVQKLAAWWDRINP